MTFVNEKALLCYGFVVGRMTALREVTSGTGIAAVHDARCRLQCVIFELDANKPHIGTAKSRKQFIDMAKK